MMWKLEYLPEATEDMEKLNNSIYPQVIKGIRKVLANPLPQSRGVVSHTKPAFSDLVPLLKAGFVQEHFPALAFA